MLKILSLHDFRSPPFDDKATVCLIDDVPEYCERARLHDESQLFATYLRDYPDVMVTPDMLATRESGRMFSAGDMFLSVQHSAFKKIASTWREKGFVEAVRFAASDEPVRITRALHWIATRLNFIFDLVERATSRNESLHASGSDSVADIAATWNWTTALVRCLSWHPHCTRLALATRDDRIRVFSKGIQGTAVLRHSAQKLVSCMSWRPNSGRELAAACQTGVLVWTVELGAASSSLSHALLLRQRNHAPITSVTWHPQGDLLVSCSPTDSNMIIWDVTKELGVPLKRVGGGGLCFTRWSPCGSKLLAATSRTIFRVWNTGVGSVWDVEKWKVPNGRVAAACFGPNLTLLFTSTEDPATIFSLPLQETIFDVKNTISGNDVKVAVPLIDLTKVSFSSNEDNEDIVVGGKVISMDWDPSGKFLAVIFQDSPMVAVFKTKVKAALRVTEVYPGCLIKGFSGEVPNCMHFHQNYESTMEMICLTIAWSSGRLQHFPIIDREPSTSSRNSTMMSNLLQETSGPQSPGLSNYYLFR